MRRPTHWTRLLSATALLTLASGAACADVYTTVSAIRQQGCGSSRAPADVPPLWRDANLGIAAIGLAGGRKLPEALERGGYTAVSAKSFHITGSGSDATIGRALSRPGNCEQVVDSRYTDINWYQRGSQTWIVLAAPLLPLPPPDLDPTVVATQILELVNAARAQGRSCGDDRYESTTPLTLSFVLTEAALAHARDMAAQQRLDHRGPDGSTVGERYTRAGYTWSASDENIARGQRDADAVVAAWLGDSATCARIMAPAYSEMGAAFALAPPGGNPPIYWAQALAAPR